MKVSTGSRRVRQTSNSFSVCASMPFGRVEHHDDAVDGEQRAVGVLAEVLVTGRVEAAVTWWPLQLEFERGGADRDAALLFHLHPVGRGVAAGLASATAPASSMAPAYSSSFSVSVVLPASGCEMIANVRRRSTSGQAFRARARARQWTGLNHELY
jgi:hypothetical protein